MHAYVEDDFNIFSLLLNNSP